MNVERPAAFVALVDVLLSVRVRDDASDAGGHKITVESTDQVGRNVEQLGIARQTGRNGLLFASGAFLRLGQCFGQPNAQVGR